MSLILGCKSYENKSTWKAFSNMFYFEREMACVTSKADELKAALKKADKKTSLGFLYPKSY